MGVMWQRKPGLEDSFNMPANQKVLIVGGITRNFIKGFTILKLISSRGLEA